MLYKVVPTLRWNHFSSAIMVVECLLPIWLSNSYSCEYKFAVLCSSPLKGDPYTLRYLEKIYLTFPLSPKRPAYISIVYNALKFRTKVNHLSSWTQDQKGRTKMHYKRRQALFEKTSKIFYHQSSEKF